MKPVLTLIIPTFNEASIITQSLKSIAFSLGEKLSLKTEIIITDDGSDELPEAVRQQTGDIPFLHIKVIKNEKRLGKGKSLALGFKQAQGDIVGFIDADLSVDPTHIHAVVEYIQSGVCDICIGSRITRRGRVGEPLLNTVLGSVFGFLIRTFIFRREKHIDTQCGFKFYTNSVARDLYTDLVAHDGLTDLEILIKASKKGHSIKKIEVPRTHSRVSKRSLYKIAVKEALSFIRIVLKYRKAF